MSDVMLTLPIICGQCPATGHVCGTIYRHDLKSSIAYCMVLMRPVQLHTYACALQAHLVRVWSVGLCHVNIELRSSCGGSLQGTLSATPLP